MTARTWSRLRFLPSALSNIANVEDLTFTGSGDFTGTGNAPANTITGGAGNDTLNGGTGADMLDRRRRQRHPPSWISWATSSPKLQVQAPTR